MTSGLRILHVDPERDWGGGEAQVFGLTRYLAGAGHTSHVATPSRGCLAGRLRRADLPVCDLTVRNHLDAAAGWRLRGLVRRGRYDVVHFHTARAHALSPWLSALGGQRVVTRRMDNPLTRGWRTRWLYRTHVDAVVAISSGVADALRTAGVPDRAVRLIPSGVDTARFCRCAARRAAVRDRYGLGEADRLIVTVGALVPRKSPDTLIDAAVRLRTALRTRVGESRADEPHYLVCGDGPLRPALEARVAGLGLSRVFHFAGFRSDLPAYLSAADVFVHVPVREGLGVAVIEALAAGLPVVASRAGGIPDVIADEQTGLLVPSRDPAALADAIARCLHDPEWAARLGRCGQTHVRARYDISASARANEALYFELLDAARREGSW